MDFGTSEQECLYSVSGDEGFEWLLRDYLHMPEYLIKDALRRGKGKLCVIQQADFNKGLVESLQVMYPVIWCWPAYPSEEIVEYKKLGFVYFPGDKYLTHQLGRWTKSGRGTD